MSETSTNVQTLKKPNKMACDNLIREILLKNPSKNRKKELLELFYNRPVTNDNIHNFLIAFEICQEYKFFPEHVAVKIDELVAFINSSNGLNELLIQICQNEYLPTKIVRAACLKSKTEHH